MSHKSKLELSERGDADTAIYNIHLPDVCPAVYGEFIIFF